MDSNKYYKGIKKINTNLRYLRLAPVIILGIFFVFCTFISAFNFYYADRFFPNTYIAGVNISNKTLDQAIATFSGMDADYNFNVNTNKIKKNITYETIGFTFDIEATVLKVFKAQREFSFFDQVGANIKSIFYPSKYEMLYSFDNNSLNLLVSQLKFEGTNHYEEPLFGIKSNKVYVIPGKSGDNFDSDELKSQIITSFITKNKADITVNIEEKDPSVTDDVANELVDDVENIISKKIKLKFEDNIWALSPDEIVAMVLPDVNGMGEPLLRVDNDEIAIKIQEIASEIDRSPSGQILKVEGNKVLEFGAPKDGISVDIGQSVNLLATALTKEESTIDLAVNITKSPDTDPNEYGIKEVLGVGKSKFAGSIKSRIHNVGLASGRVTGILVAPGETFSFVKTVGEISRKTGYQAAYVISGGRTILGDGGGVCQVSTTLFRAALDAGLPIVERNPHSYRVGYYEQDSPVGIDAAVYVPSVDLKFLNNTPKYILIASEFDASKTTLRYTIYGTSDGRKVTMSEPKVLSRTAPPSPIYEVNSSLAKGAKRMMEGSVWGASVTFDRTVNSANDELISKDTFKSYYRAWPAVYQVGPQ